jgi:hypothetical protein
MYSLLGTRNNFSDVLKEPTMPNNSRDSATILSLVSSAYPKPTIVDAAIATGNILRAICFKSSRMKALAVIGSRGLGSEHYPQLALDLDALAQAEGGFSMIISGGALGVDTLLAERYARERNLPIRIFLPDYAKYKKAAPLVRNREIIAHADLVYCLFDGKSKGTAHALREALRKRVRTIVVVPLPLP